MRADGHTAFPTRFEIVDAKLPVKTRMNNKRICLVTTGDLSSDPRIVKEADALHDAGYLVRVIALDPIGSTRPLTESILARAGWGVDLVDLGPRPIHLIRPLYQELCRAGVYIAPG